MHRTHSLVAAAAVAALLGGVAAAHEVQRTTRRTETKAPAVEPSSLEPAKHLSMVELYLRSADDSVKVIHQIAALSPSESDPVVVQEAAQHALTQIGKAETHLGHVEKMAGRAGTAGLDKAKFSEIRTRLGKARAAAQKLAAFAPKATLVSAAEQEDLHVACEHIHAHVADAMRSVVDAELALQSSSLDDVELREVVPVRGR